MSPSRPMRLLERRFTVRVPIEDAWAHLARAGQWPSWARHIRRIDMHPPGPVGPRSQGTIMLTNGLRSTFETVELNPGRNWRWVGPFLWLTVYYDHRFEPRGPREMTVSFVVEGTGRGVGLFGRLFAAIYARNLDRAIPRLIREIEGA